MPIYKCEICGKVHRTEDDVCCQSDQLAEPKPGGVSADGDGSLSCAPQATTGNEVNRPFPPVLDACCGSRTPAFTGQEGSNERTFSIQRARQLCAAAQ